MKKLFLTAILALGVFALVAAEDAIVQSVTGKVTYESAPGKWSPVKVGDKLALTVMVNTGLNSRLVFKVGDKTITVKAMQKNTIDSFLNAKVASKGISTDGTVKDATLKADGAKGTKNVSTASTRASHAAEELKWEDE